MLHMYRIHVQFASFTLIELLFFSTVLFILLCTQLHAYSLLSGMIRWDRFNILVQLQIGYGVGYLRLAFVNYYNSVLTEIFYIVRQLL